MNAGDETEMEAAQFALQGQEWLRNCPQKKRCPGALFFNYLFALHTKIERLEHELKRIKENPDES